MDLDRRQFLKTVAAGAAMAMGMALAGEGEARGGEMPQRALGSTGAKVSLVGLGGFHIGKLPTEEASIQLIRTAIDRGITFMDNCWDYHNGKSEIWMGKALRDGYRDKAFLMSKIDGRTKAAAAKQIEESLQRLQTDRIDLMQMHEVIRPHDPDVVLGENGGWQAMLEAQKAGKLRFLGFTGHKDPFVHLRMLEMAKERGVRIDAVQMPLNVMDAHFRSFEKQVLPLLNKENIGALAMKPLGSGAIVRSKAVSPVECLQYAMNLPVSVVITGIENNENLEQALQAARTFAPMGKEEVARILARTAPVAGKGQFERYKTSFDYDGTAHNPRWMF